MMRLPLLLTLALVANAAVTQLQVDQSELLGESFSPAGRYRKLTGKVHFTLDPNAPANQAVIDLKLAPRNSAGLVAFTADFALLTPEDPTRSNGKLFYEVGNRGTKAALRVLQKADAASEYGDGLLMNQGYSILWMGWQWDVPVGRMRMDLPIATDGGKPLEGLVRGNFILYRRSSTAELADRNHLAYEAVSLDHPDDFMTVRDTATGKPQKLPRADWQMLAGGKVSLKGGFAPGMIYDVVYHAKNPRVLGCSFAATRDLIAYFKAQRNIKLAYAWGGSQSGRYLRHFIYEGFNEREGGGKVFDAVLDEVGGAGRGSFNHRFGQASRDAEQHYNFFFPVDLFPFTDGPSTDPFTQRTDSLLKRAQARNVVPLMFHVLSSSEYYNRGGSLLHTDPLGKTDLAPPATTRIYLVSSAPHFPGPFPPARQGGDQPDTLAPLSPLSRSPIIRALFTALDAWAEKGTPPPDSQYPKLSDRTLVAATEWPAIPNVKLPPPALKVYQLDFAHEPPVIGRQYTTLVPAVDKNGHDVAGIHLPAIAVPVATYTGWNYRHPDTGAATELAGETGSFFPFTKAQLAARYPTKDHYLKRYEAAAQTLVQQRFLLPADLPDVRKQGEAYFP